MPDSALALLGDGGPSEHATSFITTEIFTRWRGRHLDWRVIRGADQVPGMAMIEVPSVEVGVAQFMDRPVDGAIGGSAFSTLRSTVDYPDANAYFEQP